MRPRTRAGVALLAVVVVGLWAAAAFQWPHPEAIEEAAPAAERPAVEPHLRQGEKTATGLSRSALPDTSPRPAAPRPAEAIAAAAPALPGPEEDALRGEAQEIAARMQALERLYPRRTGRKLADHHVPRGSRIPPDPAAALTRM